MRYPGVAGRAARASSSAASSAYALAPGEKRTVTLPLAADDLAYWNVERHAWVVEPGLVELMVGSSSADADLKLRRMVRVAP